VHGTTADHTRWRPVLPLLDKHATVHAVDRRGRGGSGDAPIYAIDREFQDIAAVIRTIVEATGVPVDLLGHSYGAVCALGAARLAGDAVRRLVLYEPPLVAGGRAPSPGMVQQLETLLAQGYPDQALTLFLQVEVGVPERELQLMRDLPEWQGRVAAAHTVPRELRALRDFDPEPGWLEPVTMPALLLLGGDSPPWAAPATELVRGALRNARVEVMPGQQHLAMHTAPELFADLVIRFLYRDTPTDRTNVDRAATTAPNTEH
jgi:pimeloyl-ACP methyl ester carboxylesterase